MANDGFGYDFAPWDKAVSEKFKDQLAKLGPHQPYGKVEIFRSPKGRWMAFHNPKYTDVRVVDLETGDVVATDVFSNREPKVYDGGHANFTTYVPSAFKYLHVRDAANSFWNLTEVTEYDDNDFKTAEWDNLFSLPIAFNAHTYWAADDEFYVTVLDLRDIDDGKIHVFDKVGFTLVRSASHVRQYVKFRPSFWIDMGPPVIENGMKVSKAAGTNSAERGEYTADFVFLEQKEGVRLNFGTDGSKFDFHDYTKKAGEPGFKIERRPELPWVGVQRREAEYQARKAASEQAVANVEASEKNAD